MKTKMTPKLKSALARYLKCGGYDSKRLREAKHALDVELEHARLGLREEGERR